jgi:hypothetical protein
VFFQLGTGDMLANGLHAAGFEDVRVDRIAATLEYASPEEAIGAAFAGGPVALAYSRFDPPVRDEVHAEYLASIAASRGGDGYQVPGEFVVARGVRAGLLSAKYWSGASAPRPSATSTKTSSPPAASPTPP